MSAVSRPTDALPVWLHEGAWVFDARTRREGIVQYLGEPYDRTGKCVTTAYLRPEGGGTEWTADIRYLRPAGER